MTQCCSDALHSIQQCKGVSTHTFDFYLTGPFSTAIQVTVADPGFAKVGPGRTMAARGARARV